MMNRLLSFLRVFGVAETVSGLFGMKRSRRRTWQLGLIASVSVLALFVLTRHGLMRALVELALFLHLVWYVWVVFGVFVTRGRRWLTAFHVLSLAWGIFVQVG